MAGKGAKVRGKNKDNSRRAKKKVSLLTSEKVEYVDYKDVNLLRRFTSDREDPGPSGHRQRLAQQAAVAMAIKNAREMALLPYTNRVTQQRSNRGERGERGGRAEGPPPTPSAPPPGGDEVEPENETMTDAEPPRRSRRRPTTEARTDGADPACRRRRGRQERRPGHGRRRLRPQLPAAQGPPFKASTGGHAEAEAMRRSRDIKDAAARTAAEESRRPWCPPRSPSPPRPGRATASSGR